MDMMEVQGTQLMSFAGYREFEAAADRTAKKIKEGFLEMGYILKMARDTDILSGSGYAGYEEFADRRYGLDKGTVSRYIRIVERFSVDGNSHILKDDYRDMGFAKLSIMLHMPDAIAEELMDSLSKTEVQAIREEIEAEEKISDIELAIEGAEAAAVPEQGETLLDRAVWQLGKERQEIYKKLWKAFEEGDRKRIKDIFAPAGDAIHMVRIPGTGRLMLSISGDAVSVTAVRTQEKERYGIPDLILAAERICPVAGADMEGSFFRVYGQEMEKEPVGEARVAPVQPKKEKRKESKVTKARTEEPAAEPVQEEQLPGQMNVGDYQGIVPEAQYREIPAEDTGNRSEGVQDSGNREETDVRAAEEAVPTTEPAESNGTAAGGGREADPGAVSEEEIWMEVRAVNQDLNQYLAVWERQESLMEMDVLKKLHVKAIGLAAALEKIMILRSRDE